MSEQVVLVTGATGFVGRHLCHALDRAGYQLCCAHIEPVPPPDWPAAVEWIRIGAIGPQTDWNRVFTRRISQVVHLAAVAHRIAPKDQVSEQIYDEVNHQGTAQLARAAAKAPSVRRFLLMSSIGAVTSLASEPVNEQTPCAPDTAYGRSKLAAEAALAKALEGTPVEWCIFRPPLLYGPGNPGNMERLLGMLRLGIPLPFGSIRNRRSFLFVGNLVHAIQVALDHPTAARRLFCLSDGRVMSTPELMRGLADASNRPVRLFPFPLSGLRLLGWMGSLVERVTRRRFGINRETVEKLCGSLSVDDARFRQTCGWMPPFSVEAGLKATLGTNGAE